MTNARFYLWAGVIALFSLQGCASGLSYDTYMDSVSPPSGINGRLIVYRPHGDADRTTAGVRVDGDVVGRAIPGQFFFVDLAAGDYEISAAANTDHKVPVRLVAGESNYVRVDVWLRQTRWTFTVEEIDNTLAAQQLAHSVATETLP